jgi:hypothetical protein
LVALPSLHVSSRQRFCVDTKRGERFVVSFQNISQAIFTRSKNVRVSKKIVLAALQEDDLSTSKPKENGATEAASVIEQ